MKIITILLVTLSLTQADSSAHKYLPPYTRNQYLSPQNTYIQPSTTSTSKFYGTPDKTQPELKYGPSTNPNTSYDQLSITYGTPSTVYGAPSSTYGVPGRSYGLQSISYGDPTVVHTTPLSSYGLDKIGYKDQSEPANYEFEYQVQDAESGNDFGHREQRQGNVAQGKYFVLLPDGRIQTVEYTADEEGYKPKISYQHVGGGYPLAGYSAKTEGYQF